MRSLAQKTMTLHQRETKSSAPSVILGSVSNLSRDLVFTPEYRIGLWPCVSTADPEAAMGIMNVLALLLERWQGVRVYRIFVRFDETQPDQPWSIERSQFDVDDWQLEPLDDNVGIWGSLSREGDLWTLRLSIEDDAEESEEPGQLSIEAGSLTRLLSLLPAMAREVLHTLGLKGEPSGGGMYTIQTADDDELRSLITYAFYFERDLILSLAEMKVDVTVTQAALVALGKTDDDFASWLIGHMSARALLPGFADLHALLMPVETLIEQLQRPHQAAVVLGRALYGAGEATRGIALIEAALGDDVQDADAWLTLASLYRASGRLAEAVDTFQRAIEVDAVSASLYTAYASVLPIIAGQGWEVSSYILIEPDQIRGDRLLWEAVAAYEEALTLAPTATAPILSRLALLLIELEADPQRLWTVLERLIEADHEGDAVRAVVDEMYVLDDAAPAIQALRRALGQMPHRLDLLMNLAAVYVVTDEGDEAIPLLKRALEMTDDPAHVADIERLLLAAEDPEFEVMIGEIIDRIEANNNLDDDEFEFLEDATERAPSYVEGHLLLARAYLLTGHEGTALEVLLNAEQHNPADPDICTLLGRLLWESGQHDLAFTYLNRAVEASPTHIPLLSLTGQYLFEDEQYDEAKAYLARAEAIAPRHPALIEARAYIAELINQEE